MNPFRYRQGSKMKTADLLDLVSESVANIDGAAAIAGVSAGTVNNWINDLDNRHGFDKAKINDHPFGRVTLINVEVFKECLARRAEYKQALAEGRIKRQRRVSGPQKKHYATIALLTGADGFDPLSANLNTLKEYTDALEVRPENVSQELWDFVKGVEPEPEPEPEPEQQPVF
jgi:transposase